MPRIKIEMPTEFSFQTEMPVTIGDVNYGQHMGNDAFLRYAQEARLRFLAQYGWSEKQIDGNIGLIMTEAVIAYRAQAFHGDTLTIEIAVTEITRTGFQLTYRFTNQSGTDVAHLTTGLAFFDYSAARIAKTPDAFRLQFPTLS
ncbi:MAG: thioesterase family protein [Kiritimatiellae bacterium]|nr:thioesterase family protein [Kiritimatiellia bacterium]MDD4736097.1 thioesterase family protein [Kiritimatiellia bacterium]